MIKYRAEIDGLRTLAVIPVILFHLDYGMMQGGYMGVDVFFVISGYLITKILIEDIQNNQFSIVQFWLRRIKRLLPLLLTVVLCTFVLVQLFVFRPIVKDVSKDIFPAIFSYFNVHALFNFSNYWDRSIEQSFFLHTWSLSVEEQFYLIYPFFLFFSYKYFKNFVIPITITIFLSFLTFVFWVFVGHKVDIAFYMLPARFWELSVGGLVAASHVTIKNTPTKATILSMLGVGLIIGSYIFGNEQISYSVIFPIIGSVIIILFCSPNDFVGKILTTKVFVYIGKISYSLYLWHWCIIVFFKNLPYPYGGYSNRKLILGLTILLSYLSYHFIENKTRRYRHTPKIVLAGMILITLFTLFIQSNLYNPYYPSSYNKQVYYGSYFDISPTQSGHNKYLAEDNLSYGVIVPKRLRKYDEAYKNEGIIENKHLGSPKIMLIGDSHGVMWAKLIGEISANLHTSVSCYTANGSNPFINIHQLNLQTANGVYTKEQRIAYAKSMIGNILKWKPKVVVLACRWELQTEISKKYLHELLSFLEKNNIKVVFFTQPPVLNFMVNKNATQYFSYLKINPVNGYNFIHINGLIVAENNDYIKSLALKYKNVGVYDVCQNMIENKQVKITKGKEVLYFDDDHLSYFGTFIHKEKIASIIRNAMN